MMISIVTPVYNRDSLTSDFLARLQPHLKENQITIVDNASIDNTEDMVDFYKKIYAQTPNPKLEDRLSYIKLPKNNGFGGANNIGASNSYGDIICFLSNDVVINGDFLSTIEQYDDPNVIYGARSIAFDTGWNKFRELPIPIPYLEGWCIWLNTELFHKLHGWDERFFTDYEDLDFCWNAIKNGYRLEGIKLPLDHMGGQTATQLEGGRLKYTLESQKLFCEKWGLTI